MNEWKEYKLGEILTFQRGHDLPKTQMIEGKYPVAGSNGIIGYHNSFTTKAPGVTIGRSGSVGIPKLYKTDFWAHNTVLYIKEYFNSDPLFVYYFLQTFDFTQLNAGSAVPTLNRNDLHPIPIKVPEIPEQRAIASILSSLDDKIDLLHRQNKTLEQLAETVFRQYFIEDTENEYDEFPLDKIADFLNGLPCQKYPPQDSINILPVIKIKELRTGITDATDLATSKVPENYLVNEGDIIFSWSGSLDVVIWAFGKGVLNQHLFKVTSKIYPKWLCYFAIKHFMEEFRSIAEDKATTMGHIQRHHLSDAILKIPKNWKNLNNTLSPVLDKIILNNKQISSLQKLRDTLLPKLMSGEVRVKE